MADSTQGRGLAQEYPPVYGFWTNDSGTGTTALAFHMVTTYAKLFPEKAVIAIDLRPQCTLSATILTNTQQSLRDPGDQVVEQMRAAAGNQQVPKTIGGYITTQRYGVLDEAMMPADYLIKCNEYNPHLPPNMWLTSGDPSLDILAPRLSTQYPFVEVHMYLRNFIMQLQQHFTGRELVVFIDTSPGLSIYTQIGLCAITQLVVPVSADLISLQAGHNLYHLLYGLYPPEGPTAAYEQDTFASKAKEHNMNLPMIAAICMMNTVHNRSSDPALNEKLYDGYMAANEQNMLETVFRVTTPDGTPTICNSREEFVEAYLVTVRPTAGCGVAAVDSGLPFWKLVEKYHWINWRFKGESFTDDVRGLTGDVLTVLKQLLGDAEFSKANQDALHSISTSTELAEEETDYESFDNSAAGGPSDDGLAQGVAEAIRNTEIRVLAPILNPEGRLKWYSALAPVYEIYDSHDQYLLKQAPPRLSDAGAITLPPPPEGKARVLLVACIGSGMALRVLAAGLVRTPVLVEKAEDPSEDGHRAFISVTITHLQYKLLNIDNRNQDLAFFIDIPKVRPFSDPDLPADAFVPFNVERLLEAVENPDVNQNGKLYWPIAGLMFHEPNTGTPVEAFIAQGGLTALD